MTRRTLDVAAGDPRMSRLVRIGNGEGFATYLGMFEGKPAFIADSGTLADMLDEDDKIENPVHVEVFETADARDRYVHELRQTRPHELGTAPDRD